MKQILKLVFLLVIGQIAFGQAPSNYTNINGRYRWIAGMFDSTFHIPKGSTPSLRTGGSTNSGGLFYNTSDSSVYTYTGTQWIKLRGSINPSDTTNKYVTQVYKKSGSDSIFYVKGGVHTWAFNDSTGSPGGGGGGKVYYFNGGVSMGTFGGFTMYELGDTANTGAAANFTRSTTGNIANFITDPGKPGLLQIPAGVWSVDAWLSETGGGANHAEIWVEVEKWDGSTITTIATSPIEQITEGATPNLYSWSVSIPTTSLTVTDRIIIQFYISNTNGKTVTLYTQNGYVGEVHTTFTTGIGAINGLTAPAQYLVTGTSGTDFNINSATATHTFNLPTASATNRGALSTTDWSTFNNKIGGSLVSGYLTKATGTNTIDTSQIYQSSGLIGIGTTSPTQKLQVSGNAYVNGQLFAGDTALSTYQVEGILTTPYILGRKAVDTTLSTQARPTGVQGHVVGKGPIANRLQGGTFYATTDSASTANSTGSLRATTSWTAHNGSGTLANAWGGYNIVSNKTTGTITNAYGSVSGVENRGATSTINKLQGSTTEVWNNYGGTIDTAWGQVISIYNNNASSNIGAVYGLSIGRGLITPTGGTHFWRNAGTIGSSYGIYLDSAIDVGTNRFALYSNSYSDSYLKGNLGLGTTTPGGRLAIVDTGGFALKINYNSASTDANNNAALYAENNGLSSYVAILNEKTTNNTGGQYPILIESSLTSGTAQSGMATGIHFGVPDDAGNRKVTQLALRTTDPAAATYTNRAELRLWNNGSLSTPYYLLGNGNMGLGTSTPDSNLTVVNGALFQRGVRMSALPTGVGTKAVRINANGTLSVADTLANGISGTGTTNYIPKFTSSSAIGNSIIYDNGTNVGIGTASPQSKLDVQGGLDGTYNSNILINSTSATAKIAFNPSGGASTGIGAGNGTLLFYTNGANTERMRLDPSGNLGLGVTPSAWASAGGSAKGFQLGNGGGLYSSGAGNTLSTLVHAGYYNGTNWIYNYSSVSVGRYEITGANAGSTHAWYNSVGGAAGNSISFTQAMTLFSTGNLAVGGTSDNGYRINVTGDVNVGSSNGYYFGGSSTAVYRSTNDLRFYVNSGDRMAITSTGNVGIGTTSPSTALNIQSTVNANIGNVSITSTNNDASGLSFVVRSSPSDPTNSRSWMIHTNYSAAGTLEFLSSTTATGNPTTPRFTITKDGNVGIGTTSPTYKLQVAAGSVGITNTAGNNAYLEIAGNGTTLGTTSMLYGQDNTSNGYVWNRANQSVLFGTNNLERMRITSGGNVGIGATSPASKLTLDGTNGTTASQIQLVGTGVLSGYIGPSVDGLNFGTDGGGLLFRTGVTGNGSVTTGTERMRITSGGYVAIVGNQALQTVPYLQGMSFGWNKSNGQGESMINWTNAGGGTSPDLTFNFWNNTTFSERMRITSGGDILVAGTYNPHTSANRGNITLNGTSGNIIAFTNNTTQQGYILHQGGQLNIYNQLNDIIAFGTNGTERARFNAAGELLINTTSDAGDYKLQVNGNILSLGFVAVSGANDGLIVYQNGGSANLPTYTSNTDRAQINFKYAQNFPASNNYTRTLDIVSTGDATGGGMTRFFTTTNNSTPVEALRLTTSQNAEFTGSIKTAAPSGGTAKPWKLGQAGVSVGGANTTAVAVEIDGTVYYLLTAYLPEPEPDPAALPSSGPSASYKPYNKPIPVKTTKDVEIENLRKEIEELKQLIKNK